MLAELIVYACPVGPLADQLNAYFVQSLHQCGHNTAHDFMPHCTLTGFFHDAPAAVPLYRTALDDALRTAQATKPDPVIRVNKLSTGEEWHGLELDSPWLRALVADFAARANSPTRVDELRLKEWLHLSLAYGFVSTQENRLGQLAHQLVDPAAPVSWELRLYQRHPAGAWTCHQSWAL